MSATTATETGATAHAGAPPVWAVLLAAGITVWLTADLVTAGPASQLDVTVAARIEVLGVRTDAALGPVAWVFMQTGGRGAVLTVVGAVSAVIMIRRRTWQPAVRVVVALLMVTLAVYAFKLGLGRTAPRYPTGSVLFAGGQSYPSGHTVNAVLWWGLCAGMARDYDLPMWAQRATEVMAIGAPILTSLAMFGLNYHWLTDILAGAAIGIVLLWAVHLILGTRLGQWGQPRTT